AADIIVKSVELFGGASPSLPALIGAARPYHVSRSANCMILAALPEFRVLKKPVPATEVGLFGLLNTLKKSMLNRMVTSSLIGMNLNSDASWNHCSGPAINWFRHGCRLLSNVWRCTVPLFNGIQTLLVSQNDEMTVLAGAFAGSAVEPCGIRKAVAGL